MYGHTDTVIQRIWIRRIFVCTHLANPTNMQINVRTQAHTHTHTHLGCSSHLLTVMLFEAPFPHTPQIMGTCPGSFACLLCAYVRMCVCRCVCVCVRGLCVYVHEYVCVCLRAWSVCVCACVCVCVCLRAWSVCVYVCECVCVYSVLHACKQNLIFGCKHSVQSTPHKPTHTHSQPHNTKQTQPKARNSKQLSYIRLNPCCS